MINAGINLVTLMGMLLFILSLLIVPLGLRFRKPSRVENLIQDAIFALVYLLCSFILIFLGWRFDPIMQISQVLLIISTFYWIVKDILYRSSER